MNAYTAAKGADREAELHDEFVKLFEQQNRANTGGTEIRATFLKVIVRKP